MKILMLCQILLLSVFSHVSEIEISTLRNLYYQAATDQKAAAKLKDMLANINPKSSAIFVGYKGAAEMMGAKYAFSPISKLSKFNSGKKLIETAIKNDPKDIEIRFIRFSIQTNLPAFLGYDQAIEVDKQMLLDQTTKLKDEDLKLKIISYLVASKHCTKEELKKLKH